MQVLTELTEVLILQRVVGINIVHASRQVIIIQDVANNVILAERRNPVGRLLTQPLFQAPVTLGGQTLVGAARQHRAGEVPVVREGSVNGVKAGVGQDQG